MATKHTPRGSAAQSRHARGRGWLAWLLVLLAGPAAATAPLGSTQAGADCGGDIAALGPAPFGLTAQCDHTYYLGSGISYQDIATAKTGLGASLAKAGNIDVTATVNAVGGANGTEDLSLAAADGNVTFYFDNVQYGTPPFVPAWIPISFTAHAQGNSTPGLLFLQVFVDATLSGAGGTWRNQDIVSDAFDVATTLLSLPGDEFTVMLEASCGASAQGSVDFLTGALGSASDTCNAAIDPQIQFDQAAFDAKYGTQSFNLSDYYRLDVSPNVVPLPAPLWLMGSSIIALLTLFALRRSAALRQLPDAREVNQFRRVRRSYLA